MKKVFNKDGSLTEDGTRVFMDFVYGLKQAMTSDEVFAMNPKELKEIDQYMVKLIKEAVKARSDWKLQFRKGLNSTTNAEFAKYIDDKYGGSWFLYALEPEELDRLPVATLKKTFKEQKHINATLLAYMDKRGIK